MITMKLDVFLTEDFVQDSRNVTKQGPVHFSLLVPLPGYEKHAPRGEAPMIPDRIQPFGPDCREYCGRSCRCELARDEGFWEAADPTATP